MKTVAILLAVYTVLRYRRQLLTLFFKVTHDYWYDFLYGEDEI